ncbi:MAG: hypothetical protein KTR17_05780 [Cellvibrionaceae bacterium]|nr:hypothetical protein [Cellvibrionaceae bacterium]
MRLPTMAPWRCYTRNLTTALLLGFAAASANALPPGDNAGGDKKIASIESMITGLEQRLEKDPNDAKGWALLGKSFQYMKRLPEAQKAFEKAKQLGYTGSLPDLSSGEAYTKASPHGKTGYMNGTLSGAISEVTNKEMASNASSKATTNEGASDAKAPGIKVKVDIAPDLVKTLKGNETVFVYAKLPKGMPAPLAVAMKKANDLPFEMVLDDGKSMVPGHNISSASEVVIGARISTSGNAMKQAGDIEVLSQTIPTSQKEAVILKFAQVK